MKALPVILVLKGKNVEAFITLTNRGSNWNNRQSDLMI